MISLIINAEDPDSNAMRDRGILEAFQKGTVTNASILANGPSFNTANLCNLLKHVAEGFRELMVHPVDPGYDSKNAFDGPQCKVELEALLAPETKQIIVRRNIRLCDIGDISCVS